MDVGLDHLLGSGLGILRELHGDEPVVVVTTLEEDLVGGDLPLLLSSSAAAAIVGSAIGEMRRGVEGEGSGEGLGSRGKVFETRESGEGSREPGLRRRRGDRTEEAGFEEGEGSA